MANSSIHEVASLTYEDHSPLQCRAKGEMIFTVPNPNTGRDNVVRYRDAPHPSTGDWADYGTEGATQYDNAYTLVDFDDCGNAEIVTCSIPERVDITGNDRFFSSRCHPTKTLATRLTIL